MVRAITATALLTVLSTTAAAGPFSFHDPNRPRIETLMLYDVYRVPLEGARVAVFPFSAEQEGTPKPPDPSHALTEALRTMEPLADKVERLASLSLQPALPRAPAPYHLLVTGHVHRFFHVARGGTLADVSVQVFDIRDDTPLLLWKVRRRFVWKKAIPQYRVLVELAENVALSLFETDRLDKHYEPFPYDEHLSALKEDAPPEPKPQQPGARSPHGVDPRSPENSTPHVAGFHGAHSPAVDREP